MVQAQKMLVYVFLSFFLLLILPNNAQCKGLFEEDGPDHAVKTIKTEYGDIYDCIDFYKQPAFNHPLLKNHNFHPETRSSYTPKVIDNNANSWSKNNEMSLLDLFRFKDGGCPSGTVPIRRVNKYNTMWKYPEQDVSGVVFAMGQTKNDPSKKYYGAKGEISVWNPQVKPNQYSSAEIILKGGNDAIIAGWTVNPMKYGDNQTRFFIYANAGDKQCFDSECGFVVTRADIPLNLVLSPISNITGPIYANSFFVYLDENNGNYYLEGGKDNIELGFWPKDIFVGLANGATYAGCGGEVKTEGTVKPIYAPVMGAGTFPDALPEQTNFAYCKFAIVDDAHNLANPDLEEFTGNKEYNAVVADQGGAKMVYFGGPFPVNV